MIEAVTPTVGTAEHHKREVVQYRERYCRLRSDWIINRTDEIGRSLEKVNIAVLRRRTVPKQDGKFYAAILQPGFELRTLAFADAQLDQRLAFLETVVEGADQRMRG
jgi:hypothetical protein